MSTAAVNRKVKKARCRKASSPDAKLGHGPISTLGEPEIFQIRIADIKPAKLNDMVYGEIDPDNPCLDELAQLMRAQGQLEPVVLSLDNVLMSGHRRLGAAKRLKWTALKARRCPILSSDSKFETLLVAFNSQRDKSPGVRIREQLVLTDPESAYRALVTERAEASRVTAETLILGAGRGRARITKAKTAFLDAIKAVIDELQDYWPLSDRRIHYQLLNDPPLRHGNKPETYKDKRGRTHHNRYRNDKESYKALCELLTRARLVGEIPFEAIGDETRPVATWEVYSSVGPYFRRQVDQFATNYWRDLLQDQPNHIEIVGEKLTIEGIVRPVAMNYCMPYTIGRGYSSLPPRKAMFDRYKKSGKQQLVILFLADHDPEGWDIAETFAKSMRDDFGVSNIAAVKVALKPEQVQALGLPPNTDAKPTSSRFKKFSAQFGQATYELEAVPPATLRGWLDDGIRSVLHLERFNAQVEEEKKDAATVAAFKRASVDYLKTLQPVE